MNTIEIPDLWPTDIQLSVIEPIAILRKQQGALGKITQGLLRAEIRTFEEKTDEKQHKMIHSFDLIAPALNEYRITLLRVINYPEFIFPVLVQSRVFDSQNRIGQISVPTVGFVPPTAISAAVVNVLNQPLKQDPEYRIAATQDAFIKLVGQVLQSEWVRSLIESLIARSNANAQNQNGSAQQENQPSSQPNP